MNKHERYVEVCKQMELLGIKDVSTNRQKNNDTRVWRLPIKYGPDRFIEVASFSTGYVRNQNCGYSNYQLNKRCESEPQYYPEYKWCDDKDCNVKTGKFHQYTTRSCVLIPNEIDRLEYLIAYCLKNYYIKHANHVPNGQFVTKWEHEYKLERNQNKMEEICHINANHEFVVNELQNKLANSVPKWKYDEAIKLGKTTWQSKNVERIADLEDRIYELTSQVDVGNDKMHDLHSQLNLKCDHYQNLLTEKNDLENKLATIERIARINASYR